MKQIVFNIGYKRDGNSGILTYHPIVWECDFKTFAKNVRKKDNVKSLFKWAKEHHIPPSLISIYVSIYTGSVHSNYTIQMINVREYRKRWETIYKREWADGNRL